MSQTFTSHLLMVRPHRFTSNVQTLEDNIYQSQTTDSSVHFLALKEFDHFVGLLKLNSIRVTVVQDQGQYDTPDSIFPNNWISFHSTHQAVMYPMFAKNRSLQRKLPVLEKLSQDLHCEFTIQLHLESFESQGKALEGTGSLVLDRQNKIAYACLSQRTNQDVLAEFCLRMGYKACSFHATQFSPQKNEKQPIYHTNVMMSVSHKFVLIALSLVQDEKQRQLLKETIQTSGKKVLELSPQQILNFAGNTLTVKNQVEELCIIMSERAFLSLNQKQLSLLSSQMKIIKTKLDTIQKYGGGSARCMLAEVF